MSKEKSMESTAEKEQATAAPAPKSNMTSEQAGNYDTELHMLQKRRLTR